MTRLGRLLGAGLLAPMALFLSCATTRTFWVPVYALKSGDAPSNATFDPAAKAIINPGEGTTLAYYKGEGKESIVYSNPYSLNLSKKIVLENNKLKASESTAEPTSYLQLRKYFVTDSVSKAPGNAADILKKAGIPFKNAKDAVAVYQQNLFIQKSGDTFVFDQRLLQDGQEIEYLISGTNIGNDRLKDVTVLEALPDGFTLIDSACWFSNQENTDKPGAGASAFLHKVVTENGKTSAVFESRFGAPFMTGDEFQIKLRIKLDLSKLPREFGEGE